MIRGDIIREFKNSTYYQVYNNLINHKRLIDCAKKTGYKIKFLLHPILSSQADDFTPNEEVEVIPSVGDLSYEKILTESSLMVTDYSGVRLFRLHEKADCLFPSGRAATTLRRWNLLLRYNGIR